MIPSLLLASAASPLLGTHAGWVRGSWLDRGLLLIFLGLWNMPSFFLGMLLLLLFGLHWKLLPISGSITRLEDFATFGEMALDVLKHLILSLTALTLSMIAAPQHEYTQTLIDASPRLLPI
jgi:peptide/nickel transport system permease protein